MVSCFVQRSIVASSLLLPATAVLVSIIQRSFFCLVLALVAPSLLLPGTAVLVSIILMSFFCLILALVASSLSLPGTTVLVSIIQMSFLPDFSPCCLISGIASHGSSGLHHPEVIFCLILALVALSLQLPATAAAAAAAAVAMLLACNILTFLAQACAALSATAVILSHALNRTYKRKQPQVKTWRCLCTRRIEACLPLSCRCAARIGWWKGA